MPANLLLNEQLQELVESAFSAMLSLPVCDASPAASEGAVPLLAASVAIAGTYNGTVLFTCTEQFGRRAASILLGVEPAEVTLSDIHDTVAELSNIFGGGIKSILPGPSNLSLPSVAHG